MKVLRIQRKQNVNTVAQLFCELKKYAPRCAIQVPSDLEEYRLCGKGEFLQFLLTWAAWCPHAPVVTHITADAPASSISSQLRKLFDEEHGFLLGLLARRYGLAPQRSFLNARLEELAPELVENAFAACRIFQYRDPLFKRTRAFLALDDLMNQDGRVLNAYTNVYRRRNPDYSPMKKAFRELLGEIFNRTPHQSFLRKGQTLESLNGFFDCVTQFIYEVYENADRWGAYPYDKSIRGILAHLHFRESPSAKPLVLQVGVNNPLCDYLKQFAGADGYERTAFLELTVFDNGPTLATHFLGKEPKSLRRDYEATLECLLLASGRGAKSTEGKGLYETMKLLAKSGGFLRYRAKRLCLYRDFLADPLDLKKLELLEEKPREERRAEMQKLLFLNDWLRRNSKPRAQLKAVGTFFTIIVPVGGISHEGSF